MGSVNTTDQPSSMRLVVFVLVLVGLFIIELTGPVQDAVIMPFTALIADISSWIVQLFDSSVEAEGIIIRNVENNAAVAIQPGCNGVEALICLTAAVIAFPARWTHKLIGLAVGTLAIQALNIVRVISLFYLLQWDKTWFEWAHLYLWQALIILDALFVFIIWVRMLPRLPAPTHEQSAVS